MKVTIELIEDGKMPTKGTEKSSCFDVYAREVVHNPRYIAYKLGFKTKLPKGWEGRIYARSSVSKYDISLANGVGVVDEDYRGEWEARFKITPPNFALNSDGKKLKELLEEVENAPKIYEVGDRVAQIEFKKKEKSVELKEGEVKDDTERSSGGFGSTGK